MDEFIKLLAALGPLLSGLGTTVGVLVIALRKGREEREQAATNAVQIATVDQAQTEAIEKIMARLEEIQPGADGKSDAIQQILDIQQADPPAQPEHNAHPRRPSHRPERHP